MDQEPGGEAVEETSQESAPIEAPKAGQRVSRITRITLSICLAFFVWYLAADRITPSSNQGRVRGRSVPVVPEVSGVIQEVFVDSNDLVTGGQPLLQINATNHELAGDYGYVLPALTPVEIRHASLLVTERWLKQTNVSTFKPKCARGDI